MAALTLLTPIIVDTGHTLLAGLHRIEAAKLLGRTEISAFVGDFTKLQAELVEIDENFVRSPLSDMERNDMLLRRKQIYEELHPETKNGGAKCSEKRACLKKTGKANKAQRDPKFELPEYIISSCCSFPL